MEALLCRLREGHPAATAQFYDEFQGLVRGLVYRLLGPDPDLDDLVQRAFELLFARVRQMRDATALPAWVRTVTVNLVRDELRARKLKRLLFIGGRAAAREADEQGHTTDTEARDLVRRVLAALDRLSIDERLAFQMRYIEDATLPEAAEACGCSLATLKRRLTRAEERFGELAAKDPALAARLSTSPHWGNKG
jgi:RNA polymerase sigma-70 factor (ECF subfamily)